MAEQEQHTPGPWRYVENRNTPRVDSEATGQRVCNFFGGGGLYASYKANGRLIVAAPQMLKALRRIGMEKCYCQYHYPDEGYECAHEIALDFLGLRRQELFAQEPAS